MKHLIRETIRPARDIMETQVTLFQDKDPGLGLYLLSVDKSGSKPVRR